ncbi:MAG: VWA domain-containing protein [Betaproteobacteria bacterium]|nr:VWA domain-containing protein [Betaproteobacteria bacterium]
MTDPRWQDALAAAALLAVDPVGLGGVVVRAAPGPVRDAWLAALAGLLVTGAPVRRIPAQIPDARLLGGLDLTATLSAGRPVAERGLLAEADGGVVVVPMAERMSAGTAGRLAAVLDAGEVRVERDGIATCWPARIAVVALDEGLESEDRPPVVLMDRLGLWIDLDEIAPRDLSPGPWDASDVVLARAALRTLNAADSSESAEAIEALCGVADAIGIASPRPVLASIRAARAAAALEGRTHLAPDDIALAARLLLAPRATRMPPPERPSDDASDPPPAPEQTATPPQAGEAPESPPPPAAQSDSNEEQTSAPPDVDASGQSGADPDTTNSGASDPVDEARPLAEVVLEAVQSALPAGLLAQAGDSRTPRSGSAAQQRSGRVGAARTDPRRGRPDGTQRGDPRRGPRLDLVATLRAAAPWQRLRRREGSRTGIEVRTDDFRVVRRVQRATTTTIFVVDASGSSALNRLAEAKGAVEILLAECYVRRDRVALVAFHGQGADLVLPPTRSLVRARRSLAGLPGGGGTPLAAGLEVGATVADTVRRQGDSPLLVVLTDGRANVSRDRQPGRPRAQDDALAAARQWRTEGYSALLVDTSPRSHPAAQALAQAMGARFLPLPYADSSVLSSAVTATVASERKGPSRQQGRV